MRLKYYGEAGQIRAKLFFLFGDLQGGRRRRCFGLFLFRLFRFFVAALLTFSHHDSPRLPLYLYHT